MGNYTNPDVVLIPNPIGLDAQVQKLQIELGNIPYLKAFGLAQVTEDLDRDNPKIYPAIYFRKLTDDYIDLRPTYDFAPAYSFFLLEGGKTYTKWGLSENDAIETNLSLIIFGNLKLVDDSYIYRYTEVIEKEIKEIIRGCPNFTLNEIMTEFKDVWSGFTLNDAQCQYSKHPSFSMKFRLKLSYVDRCS